MTHVVTWTRDTKNDTEELTSKPSAVNVMADDGEPDELTSSWSAASKESVVEVTVRRPPVG